MKKSLLLCIIVSLVIICTSCGKKEHVHDYSETVVAPTCTEGGYTIHLCECGDKYIDSEVPATGHNYVSTVVAATCKEGGYTEKVCSVCQNKVISDKTEKTNIHDWNEIRIDATCTKEGSLTRRCKICNLRDKTETLPKIPHTLVEQITASTCTEKGTKKMVCSVCQFVDSAIELDLKEHVYSEPQVVAPTCLKEGYTVKTCTVCAKEVKTDSVPALGHDLKTTDVAPTCEMPGYSFHKCQREGCTYEYNDNQTDKLGHNYPEVPTEVPATCIKDGSKAYYCTRCSKVDETRLEVIPMTGIHDFTIKQGDTVAASCTEAAYDIMKCSCDKDCTETQKKYVEGSLPLGHDISHTEEYHVPGLDLVSTCKEQGYTAYKCKRCDYIEKDMLEFIAHTQGDQIRVVEPTCISKGYTIYKCSVCNNQFNDNYVDETGKHDCTIMVENSTVLPTCTSEGYTVYRCCKDKDCTYTENKDITVREAHNFVDDGHGIIRCSVCNTAYSDINYPEEVIESSGSLGLEGVTVVITGNKELTDPLSINSHGLLEKEISDTGNKGGIIKIIPASTGSNFVVSVKIDGKYVSIEAKYYKTVNGEIIIDLYNYSNITSVKIETAEGTQATVYIYK